MSRPGAAPLDAPTTVFLLNRVDDQSGGTLRATIDLATSLTGFGRQVVVSAPICAGQSLREIDARHADLRPRLFRVGYRSFRIGFAGRQLRWLVRNRAAIDELHVHSLFYVNALLATIVCRILRIPVVLWPHGCLDEFDLAKRRAVKLVFGFILLRVCAAASSVVAFTSDQERESSTLFGSTHDTVVTPLPVASVARPGTGPQWRASMQIDAGDDVVLFLGRIAQKKNLPVLIEAAASLDRADLILVIAGESPTAAMDAQLRGLATSFRTKTRIRFTGWLDAADKARALDAADLFVLPSDNENFGIAIVEALLARVPVLISPYVHLAGSLSRAGCVAVCDPDVASLAPAIAGILDNKGDALAAAGRGADYCEAHFSMSTIGRRLTDILADRRTTDRRIIRTAARG